MTVFERQHLPSLGGATGWLNSEPLGPAELRGHVVARELLDADLHQLAAHGAVRPRLVAGLPGRRAGRHRRPHAGVLVRARASTACGRRRRSERSTTRSPLDNDYAIWSAFDNHYWPALYFVDADGIIRDHHFGEGRYEQSERVIQRLLGVERELVSVEGARRGGGGRLGPPAHARDLSRLRARRALRVTGRRRVRRTPRLRAPRAPAPQPLGARRRVDDRARERRARPGRREHRLPLPRARRAPRAVSRSARADPVPRAPRRRGSGPVARRRRRRGRQRRAPRRPPLPARARARRGPRADAARSRSSSPAPRRTCSRSDRKFSTHLARVMPAHRSDDTLRGTQAGWRRGPWIRSALSSQAARECALLAPPAPIS